MFIIDVHTMDTQADCSIIVEFHMVIYIGFENLCLIYMQLLPYANYKF